MFSFDLHTRRGEFILDSQLAVTSTNVIALFGHSGSGKSTTLNLIAGLLSADHGYIKLNDRILFDSSKHINVCAEHRQIGYVFQDARLFPHFTVTGNLQYGLRRAQQRTQTIHFDTVVELLGLAHLLKRRPQQLSGGEKQRVAIGRALLSQPQLLLLDEPLASLDMARREEVLPHLERLRDFLKIPMVYVSHQYEEILRIASHVVLMSQGQCLAQGDLPSISHRPELRSLLGAEAMGTVIEGRVEKINHADGLAQIGVGHGQLSVASQSLSIGQQVRLQLLARDLILAIETPHGLSVRNLLSGTITQLTPDDRHAVLVEVDVGNVLLIARVTTVAARELALRPGLKLWVLVKAVTLRGHVFTTSASMKGLSSD